MKVFLTGITGFLGHHVAQSLHAQGHEIYGLVRQPQKMESLPIPFHAISGSLSDCSALPELLSKMDAVIHIAGKIKALNAEEFNETNQLGTRNLLEAVLKASRLPALYVHISTIAVLGQETDGSDFCIAPENCHPLSWYGESKRRGEMEVKALSGKVRSVILRPPVLYGPHDKEMGVLFKAIQRGIAPLYSEGSNKVSICYAQDIADCIVSFLQNPPPQDEIYCLDDGEIHSWRSIAQGIAHAMKKNPFYFPIPAPFFKIAAFFTQTYAQLSGKAQILTLNKIKEMQQKSWVCGHEKLSKTRAWKPRYSFAEGAKITKEFYQKHGWL